MAHKGYWYEIWETRKELSTKFLKLTKTRRPLEKYFEKSAVTKVTQREDQLSKSYKKSKKKIKSPQFSTQEKLKEKKNWNLIICFNTIPEVVVR